MNEEQLANLLAQHLDMVLAGERLPEMAPAEVVELLAVAQTLSEIAPALRPEFGAALEESLRSVSDSREFAGDIIPNASVSLGPMNEGDATSGASSTFRSSTLFTLIIGLLLTVAGLALVAGLVIFVTSLSKSLSPAALPNPAQPLMAPTLTGPAGSLSPTVPPVQRNAGDDTPNAGVRTQTPPAQSPSPLQTPSSSPPTTLEITSTLSAKPAPSPALIVTPIVDVLPAVIITFEIKIDPPALVPGPSGQDSGGNGGGSGDNGSGGSSGDNSSSNSDGGNSSSGGDSGNSDSGSNSGGGENDDDDGEGED